MNDSETIRDILETAILNLKNVCGSSTVVGEPILTQDGTTVVPVSKVSLGFAAGGSDFATKTQATHGQASFGGGSGAGVSVTPLAFLVVTPHGEVNLLPVDRESPAGEKLLELVPGLVEKMKEYFSKK